MRRDKKVIILNPLKTEIKKAQEQSLGLISCLRRPLHIIFAGSCRCFSCQAAMFVVNICGLCERHQLPAQDTYTCTLSDNKNFVSSFEPLQQTVGDNSECHPI